MNVMNASKPSKDRSRTAPNRADLNRRTAQAVRIAGDPIEDGQIRDVQMQAALIAGDPMRADRMAGDLTGIPRTGPIRDRITDPTGLRAKDRIAAMIIVTATSGKITGPTIVRTPVRVNALIVTTTVGTTTGTIMTGAIMTDATVTDTIMTAGVITTGQTGPITAPTGRITVTTIAAPIASTGTHAITITTGTITTSGPIRAFA